MKTLKIIMITMLLMNLGFSQESSVSYVGVQNGVPTLFINEISEDSPFGFLDVPPNKYDYYSDLGIKWLELARENERLGWGSVEKEEGVYDFSEHDASVNQLYEKGLNVIYVTRPINPLYGTKWEEFNISETDEYPDGHLDEWANFIRALVERYDGDGVDDAPYSPPIKIKYYQFVHELGPIEASYWQQHRDEYAEVFEITYNAMKEACGDCVLSMPVPHMDDLEEEGNFLSDVLGYLKGKDIQDIGFDYHSWSIDRSKPRYKAWETKGENYRDRITIIDRIKEIAQENGFDASNIISLESGMAATQEMEYDQAAYVIRSYVSSLAHGQKKLFWTSLVEYGHYSENSLFTHVGLIHNPKNADGLSYKKLSYYTYKLMIEKLEGSDWDNIQTLIDGTNNVYAYKFKKKEPEIPTWVVWWDYFDDLNYEEGDVVTFDLNVGNIDSVKITQAVPDAESGADLNENEYPAFFHSETKQVVDGTVIITLGVNPVFVEVLSSTISIEEETGLFIPKDFYLEQNYPNPFNPSTTIEYQIPVSSHITLSIFNVLGQEVRTLVDENKSAGSHSAEWNGKDSFGKEVAGGIYFLQLRAKDLVQTKKLLLLK